ncbi:hypothetical protein LTR53_009415 [Teratosphaeriaceae sp. CCFEE 6253]|nr:hypothetical protein LTR53_009415 [Teratosphaeriaceae sp. CCFEE 6253]
MLARTISLHLRYEAACPIGQLWESSGVPIGLDVSSPKLVRDEWCAYRWDSSHITSPRRHGDTPMAEPNRGSEARGIRRALGNLTPLTLQVQDPEHSALRTAIGAMECDLAGAAAATPKQSAEVHGGVLRRALGGLTPLTPVAVTERHALRAADTISSTGTAREQRAEGGGSEIRRALRGLTPQSPIRSSSALRVVEGHSGPGIALSGKVAGLGPRCQGEETRTERLDSAVPAPNSAAQQSPGCEKVPES